MSSAEPDGRLKDGPLRVDELELELPPRVWPLELKTADDRAGPLAASAEAAITAERKADGFAPRIVLETDPFFIMRKVGMLDAC